MVEQPAMTIGDLARREEIGVDAARNGCRHFSGASDGPYGPTVVNRSVAHSFTAPSMMPSSSTFDGTG